MITAKAVVTVGRFMWGGWDGLKAYVVDGGRLPFCQSWSHPYIGPIGDVQVVVMMKVATALRLL